MFYYLNHWQVLTLIHAIEEIKKNNPYFQDTVSDEFVKNCFEEATRIAITPTIKLKLIPKANKVKVSESMFKYVTALTGIDVFDKKKMKEILPEIKKILDKDLTEIFAEYENKNESSLTNENNEIEHSRHI